MKKYVLFILLFLILICAQNNYAQFVDINQTAIIAENWTQMVIDKYGHWGDSKTAISGNMQELRDNGKLIGYYCTVQPKGYIVISLRRELAPVKVYSDRRNIDFLKEVGMPRLIKSRINNIIDIIESNTGPVEIIGPAEFDVLSDENYREQWYEIENYIPGSIKKTEFTEDNYQEGDSLVVTKWNQRPPYNNDCPFLGCTTTSNGRALVGCVATAGAQIMKYWNWPPNGNGGIFNDTYDWMHMDTIVTTSSPQVYQAAVSELCFEVGDAISMNYGCNASSANTSDMKGIYENNFRYENIIQVVNRTDYNTRDEWFDLIKEQINQNRPIQYRIHSDSSGGHSIACDGWQEIAMKQYHMNYGWAGSHTNWYTVDYLHNSNPDHEYMLINIVPDDAVGATMAGTYIRTSYAHRYFDQDTQGSSAIFRSGQSLQVMPGIIITGTGTSDNIRFEGAPGLSTLIYCETDSSDGIHIYNGVIQLRNGGTIELK